MGELRCISIQCGVRFLTGDVKRARAITGLRLRLRLPFELRSEQGF